jgi:exonuclease SbcD
VAIRIAHVADIHLGLLRHGRPLSEWADTWFRFCELATTCDLAVIAGDLAHSRNPAQAVNTVMAEGVAMLRDAGVETIIVPGTHDGPHVIADPRTHTLAWVRAVDLPGIHVRLDAEVSKVSTKAGDIMVTSIPYPHRRAYDKAAPDVAPADRVELAERELEETLRTLGVQALASKLPTLFVGHLSVAGSELASERQMQFGWDVTVPGDVFDAWDYAALGHIHKMQRAPGSRAAWYPGAPEYHEMREAGMPRAFLVATVGYPHGQPTTVEVVDSGARPIQIITGRRASPRLRPWTFDVTPQAGALVQVQLEPGPLGMAAGEEEQVEKWALGGGAFWAEVVIAGQEPVEALDRPMATASTTPKEAMEAWVNAHVEEDMRAAVLEAAANIMEGAPA